MRIGLPRMELKRGARRGDRDARDPLRESRGPADVRPVRARPVGERRLSRVAGEAPRGVRGAAEDRRNEPGRDRQGPGKRAREGHGARDPRARFADKLRECARIALEEHGGDLAADRPGASAGRPGARSAPTPESASRAPRRSCSSPGGRPRWRRTRTACGFSRGSASCARRSRTRGRTPPRGTRRKRFLPEVRAMQRAHLLLQEHGRALCKRTAPRCEVCPLARKCVYARDGR